MLISGHAVVVADSQLHHHQVSLTARQAVKMTANIRSTVICFSATLSDFDFLTTVNGFYVIFAQVNTSTPRALHKTVLNVTVGCFPHRKS